MLEAWGEALTDCSACGSPLRENEGLCSLELPSWHRSPAKEAKVGCLALAADEEHPSALSLMSPCAEISLMGKQQHFMEADILQPSLYL